MWPRWAAEPQDIKNRCKDSVNHSCPIRLWSLPNTKGTHVFGRLLYAISTQPPLAQRSWVMDSYRHARRCVIQFVGVGLASRARHTCIPTSVCSAQQCEVYQVKKKGSTEHCRGNKTVPGKVATTRTEDGHRLPKQALQYQPNGRRNIGRPRRRWRDQLHLEDQGTGNTPNPAWTWWWWWFKARTCSTEDLARPGSPPKVAVPSGSKGAVWSSFNMYQWQPWHLCGTCTSHHHVSSGVSEGFCSIWVSKT